MRILDFSGISDYYNYYAGTNYHENLYVLMTSWEYDKCRGSCPIVYLLF